MKLFTAVLIAVCCSGCVSALLERPAIPVLSRSTYTIAWPETLIGVRVDDVRENPPSDSFALQQLLSQAVSSSFPGRANIVNDQTVILMHVRIAEHATTFNGSWKTQTVFDWKLFVHGAMRTAGTAHGEGSQFGSLPGHLHMQWVANIAYQAAIDDLMQQVQTWLADHPSFLRTASQ